MENEGLGTGKAPIASGADVNAKDSRGKTALDIVRENGRDEIVSLLEKAVAE